MTIKDNMFMHKTCNVTRAEKAKNFQEGPCGELAHRTVTQGAVYA